MADEKEIFRAKVASATDNQLSNGYGALKKKTRLATVKLDDEREDVENMLQNPSYLTAVEQVETAKRALSILTWKLSEVQMEMARRFQNTPENNGDY